MAHDISVIIHIGVIWAIVVTIPGPNFIAVTHHAISDSRKAGVLTAAGVSAGAAVWATVSLLGLTVLFGYAPWLYAGIRLVGGAYLIVLGLRSIFHALDRNRSGLSRTTVKVSNGSAFKKGILTSFSNPKTAAFFGSLFAATFPPQTPVWMNAIAVLTIFSTSLFWYGFMACCFSLSRVQTVYGGSKKIVDILSGSLLSILGVRIIFSRS